MVRFKNRYVVCEISSAQHSKGKPIEGGHQILHWILQTVEQIHGEFGAAAVRPGLSVKYCNTDTKICIIRARHGPHQLLISALPFAAGLMGHKLQIRTLYIGASLSCCYKFLQRHQRSQIDVLWSQLDSAGKQELHDKLWNSDLAKFMQEGT